MTEQWRTRCPRGHTTIRMRRSGFYCQSCGGRYAGDPVDAARVDEWPADDREPEVAERVHERELLAAIVDAMPSDNSFVRASDLNWSAGRITNQLVTLERQGFIERDKRSAGSHWRPTDKGRRTVRGKRVIADD